MQVHIKDVKVEWAGEGKKRWGKAVVLHEKNGKDFTQNVVSFKNPEVFKKVQEMVGQTVEVESVKDGDFWNWKSINATTAGANSGIGVASTTSATRVSGSNYETKEERAARQVLIVKQSSLSAAVESLSVGAKTAPSTDDVLKRAQEYTDWVFAKDDGSIEEMSDDIPF